MKKILSVIITALMAVVILAVSAFAADVGIRVVTTTSSSGRTSVSEGAKVSVKSSNGLKNGSLPSSYDSRDYGVVTSVKDQGKYGSCWAFAATSCAESNLLSENKNLSAKTLDLSETHLAYFTYSNTADKLGLTSGDKVTLNGYNFLDIGGNTYGTTSTYAKWFGVANESVAPYKKATGDTTIKATKAYSENVAILENASWIDSSDLTSIKKMIMTNGAVSISYYCNDTLYLNEKNNAYYYFDRAQEGNHQVTVVGWDDNFSKDNFGYASLLPDKYNVSRPSKNGAWLVKNSYGTSAYDDGYMWISYYDKSVAMDVVASYDFQSADTYDNNYQYDGCPDFSYMYFKNKIYTANVYTANGSEILKSIGIFSMDDSATYKYQIYLNPTDSSDPTSGTAVFSTYKSAGMTYAGFHTVVLPTQIQLAKGDKFAVVVAAVNSGKECDAVCEINQSSADGSVTEKASISKGQSFYSENGKDWDDNTTQKLLGNNKIKAYTCNGTLTPTKITASDVTVVKGKTKTISVSATPKFSTTSSTVTYTSSDSTVATVSAKGVVTGKKAGICTITIRSKADSSVSTKITVTVKPTAPTGLNEVSASTNSIKISWISVAKASGYRIYLISGSTKKYLKTVSGTSCTISGLKAGTKYKFAVRAYCTAGSTRIFSTYSSALTATTRPAAPSLKLTKNSNIRATLSWGKVTGASKYVVYRYNSSQKKYVKLAVTTSTKYVLRVPANGSKYLVKAIAKANGISYYSVASNVVTFKK